MSTRNNVTFAAEATRLRHAIADKADVLAYIAEQQKPLDLSRSQKAPRRRGQGASLFKAG